jgi:hypothetical protein
VGKALNSKLGSVEGSPKKSATISDSTSALSKDTDSEDTLRFPIIGKGYNQESAKDFRYARIYNRDMDNWINEVDSGKLNSISIRECLNNRAKLGSPQKPFGNKYERILVDNYRRVPRQPAYLSNRESLSSMNYSENEQVTPINDSRNLEKYTRRQSFSNHDGYDTDRKSSKKRERLSDLKYKSDNTTIVINPDEYGVTNILPVYESSSEEESAELDILSDFMFEELSRLADDSVILPDIHERRKQMLEATFRYQNEDGYKNEPGHDQYVSFDKVLAMEGTPRSPCKTVEHKSAKAKSIGLTPFRLSTANPEECGQKTAYFGDGA